MCPCLIVLMITYRCALLASKKTLGYPFNTPQNLTINCIHHFNITYSCLHDPDFALT